ncbi:MAG: UDP-N-acetylmuramoyl-L-alanyl-D-glutamate--2,6-diaminopimelate ligase [Thermomicrobiales bacterium]|nr:UDP-N-acetylmuramoyl-L-alanyl-D-glutamate--2,6-diaminopimelate ligase [Thermomicrobiales bacterium]
MSVSPVRLAALAKAVPGASLLGSPATLVSGITYDSRQVGPGDLFAALRGADFDGHDFVEGAVRRGAAALLVEEPTPLPVAQIVVPDSRAALAPLSAVFFGHPSRKLGVIGITGTDGKTTTSYLVDHILRSAGEKTGMIGTVTIRIGEREDRHASRQTTPESSDVQRYLRQMADDGVSWAILEATSHGLAMHRLDAVRFRIGAVTNITHEHLDFHGTVEGYRRAKAILCERVGAESGVVVVNADDPGAVAIEPFAAGAEIMRYSTQDARADLQAVGVQASASGTRFRIASGEHGAAAVELPLIGAFNVSNALCAAGVALAAGIDLPTIAEALSMAPPIPGRMARVDAGQPFAVVVDYAHTPDSLRKVLTLLRGLHPTGRLIAVFGSAGERDREKRSLQGAVSARLADITVVTSEDPRNEDADAIIAQIAAGAEEAGATRGEDLFQVPERREALRLAFDLARPGDCVLLAGKGHEGSIIWGREKRPWDEAGVARELLAEAGYEAPSS